MPTQPVTPVGPAMAMLQALDGLLGASIGAAVAPHIAAAVSSQLASIVSPEKIEAAIAAQIQTALNGTQAELRRLSEVVEHLQQTQAAQVPLSSVVPEKASLDEVLQAVLPRLREIGTSDSKQTLSSYYGPLYELLSLLRKVVPSRKEQINTTDITELAMTLSLLLLEYRDGTSQERDNLIAKHGVALGDLNDLVQVLTLDHTERERALTFQKERSS